MTCGRIMLAGFCSLALIVGCAKTDDSSGQGSNAPATQPSMSQAVQSSATESPTTAPTASMLKINGAVQWFPPACLRVTTKNGKVIARLYSDDPREVLTGKATVNSYDLVMVLPGISDPADIAKAVWVNESASMDRQDTPYGIFLNNQEDVLQPLNVTVRFQGRGRHVKVSVQGSFAVFHVSDGGPHPAMGVVDVKGLLDAVVPAGK